MKMALFILVMLSKAKKKVKDYIYSILTTSISEIGKEIIWMGMEHISLLQDRFIKDS